MPTTTTVTIQSLPDRTYAQLLVAGGHALVADEPESTGGDGLGPTPIELLLGALGACTAITLQMYARKKGWDLAEVSVQVSRERRRDEASGEADVIDDIRQEITMRGRLTDEQRERLLEIAGRCPVHRMLAGSARITEMITAGA